MLFTSRKLTFNLKVNCSLQKMVGPCLAKLFFLLTTFYMCLAQMGKSTITKDGTGGGTISLGTPDLTDEESQANFMPTALRCDACTAITERFKAALEKDINKVKAIRSGKKEISEGRLIEIFEDICGDREWSGYGLKEVNGVNRLSFPGGELSEVAGIMQGGGIWPRRLADMCYSYVGQYDEYRIYKAHTRDRKEGILKLLCIDDCKKPARAQNEL